MSSNRNRSYNRRRQVPPPRRSLPPAALAFGAGLLILLVVVVFLARRSPEPPPGVESYEVESANHVEGVVSYPQTPPVGGDHNPAWQNCGFYSGPIRNENAVHSMEHGAVWITYKQDLQQDQTNRIRQLALGQTHVLASSYPNLPGSVVVSAWGRQLKLDSADDPKLEQFINYFRQGPTTPERGAPCSGGVGTPR